jgi:1,4-dihydroxy-2-naphthoate octaprenyltransferase
MLKHMNAPKPMAPLPAYLLAARLKTLPAAVVPVVIGGALAANIHRFDFLPWLICLAFALLVQVGTNYANDYLDHLKGADGEGRLGPARAVASGWITPAAMRKATLIVFASAFCIGLLLIPYGGWWLVGIGILSILCGLAYTGGPFPLAYNGLGDLFVFLFFGWVATGVTYYVQSGTFVLFLYEAAGFNWLLMAGAVPGALATNLLVVNNVRDAPLDREAGKRTLVALFGRRFGIRLFASMQGLVLLIFLLFALVGSEPGVGLGFLVLPLMALNLKGLLKAQSREDYDRQLALTAASLLVGGMGFALGLLII